MGSYMEAANEEDPDEIFVIEVPGVEFEGETANVGEDSVEVKLKKIIENKDDPTKVRETDEIDETIMKSGETIRREIKTQNGVTEVRITDIKPNASDANQNFTAELQKGMNQIIKDLGIEDEIKAHRDNATFRKLDHPLKNLVNLNSLSFQQKSGRTLQQMGGPGPQVSMPG